MADTVKKEEKTEVNLEEELMADYESEMGDNEKYLKLAEEADKMYPCRGYGAILRDIAREEEVHRRHLRLIIEDMKKWAGEENG